MPDHSLQLKQKPYQEWEDPDGDRLLIGRFEDSIRMVWATNDVEPSTRAFDIPMLSTLSEIREHLDKLAVEVLGAQKPQRVNADLLAALEALLSNPCLDLGDLVYAVREKEGKGWDGLAASAWAEAVMAAKAAVEKARSVEAQ